MKEEIYEDGKRSVEEDFGNFREIRLYTHKMFSKDGSLLHEIMMKDKEPHGVYITHSLSETGQVRTFKDVYFNGAPIAPRSYSLPEEVYLHKLEDFFLKDATQRLLGNSPFVEDDSLLLPVLRRAEGNLDEVLNDLSLKGLDSEYILEAGLEPYDYERNIMLYANFHEMFESGDYDMYQVAERFMERYDVATFPDVMVSEALKQETYLMVGAYKEELQETLNAYVPQLKTSDLENGLNLLETHSIEIKDSIENEYNLRVQGKAQQNQNKVTTPTRKRGRSL